MNFLAHLWLAGPEVGARLGAVAGDFVKGPLPGACPADIAEGVRLHRAIDAFADTHPAFRASRTRVSAARRRFAGVMVDMFYDHFLAARWTELHPHEPLPEFAARQYALLAEHAPRLPVRARALTERMADGDWLSSYAEVDTIGYALDRIAARLSQPDAFLGGGEELRRGYAGFEADALRFLADAQRFAEAYRGSGDRDSLPP